MQIQRLSTKSKLAEVAASVNRIITAYERAKLFEDAYLPGIMTDVKPLAEDLIVAIKRPKAKSELEEKDAERDSDYRAIAYMIQGCLYHSQSEIREAALRVNKVYRKYGLKLAEESYNVQSSLLHSLLIDFEEPAVAEAISVLPGVKELVGNLKKSQEIFDAASLSRIGQKVAEDSIKSATDIQGELLQIINSKLVIYLRAMIALDEPKFGKFAREVALIINENNTSVFRRGSRGN